ncbi:MAG TPA: radical SAM protein [Candidatus Lokiarchaeia archaeon]|nr:radical SAM protein [Candidatus Lokiarchaeia archaeon]
MACIAAVLEADGHFVRILDLNVLESKKELASRLQEKDFDLVGYTSMTSSILNCYKNIRVIKKKLPRAKVVLGGWHASAVPRRTMEECAEIDFIVKGEGEETMKDLVKAIEQSLDYNQVNGILFRDGNGEIIETPDRHLIENLDKLPFPARHLLPLEEYRKIGFQTVGGKYRKSMYVSSISTSRGCTSRCKFCSDAVLYKNMCRSRTAENIVSEIEQAIKEFNIRAFFMMDSNFTYSPVRVRRICELIIKKKLDIVWGCHGRADNVSLGLLRLMKAAGCNRIAYGIESGSPKILKALGKKSSLDKSVNAIRWTKMAGIQAVMYLLFGWPGETRKDMQLTQQLVKQSQPDIMSITMLIPYPGTDVYEMARQNNLIQYEGWEHYGYPYSDALYYPGLDDTFKFQMKMFLNFYLSPSYILRSIKNIGTIYRFLFLFKTLCIFLLGEFLYRFGRVKHVTDTLKTLSSRERIAPRASTGDD